MYFKVAAHQCFFTDFDRVTLYALFIGTRKAEKTFLLLWCLMALGNQVYWLIYRVYCNTF